MRRASTPTTAATPRVDRRRPRHPESGSVTVGTPTQPGTEPDLGTDETVPGDNPVVGPETVAAPTLASIPMFADTAGWVSPAAAAGGGPADPPVVTDAADGSGRGWVAEDAQIDWQLVRRLKLISVSRVEEHIKQHRARHGLDPSVDDRREMGRPIIHQVVSEHAQSDAAQGYLWTPVLEDRYYKAVFDSQFGYGRLQPLFEIPTAENITIHGCDSVKVHHTDGTVERWPPVADSDEELLEQLRQMGSNAQPVRTLDGHHLDMTLMLDERFRLHAYSNEIGVRPRVAIRQHLLTQISLGDLADRRLMPNDVALFLDAAVRANTTLVVAGEQAVGKTTLLRALIDSIPLEEEFGTLETDLELFSHKLPGRDNSAALFSRSGMGERGPDGARIGEVSVSSLVDMALRQYLQRIIVGEVRGAEASALFQAMTVGTGTMFTLHSRDPETIPIRLASRIAEGRVYSIDEALRQIGLLLQLIVYVEVVDERGFGGQRYRRITQISHCTPGEQGRPSITPIFTTDEHGDPLTFNPPPELLHKLRRYYRDTLPRREGR
jgi:pilus assembly protein CpaF